MKHILYFKEEENKLNCYINNEKIDEIDLEVLEEEKIVTIIEKELQKESSLQIIIEEENSSIVWEKLRASYGIPYGCSNHSPLSHSVKTKNNKTPVPRGKVTGALKILVAGSAPESLSTLDIQKETLKINSALKDLQSKGIVILKLVKEDLTSFSSLIHLIQKEKPDIFHFIGHTIKNNQGEYELALKDGNFGIRGVGTEHLSSLLIDNGVQFTFLNACDSIEIAKSLAKEGLATIGMRKEIEDKASSEFSETLYRSLSNGDRLDIAINNARHSLYLLNKEKDDWSYPTLYTSNNELLGFKIKPTLVPMSELTIECNNTKSANVFIDNKLIGLTPITTSLHIDYPIEIVIEKEGYHSKIKKFRAINPKEFFSTDLEPILGNLVIETHPKIGNVSVKCQRIDNPKEYMEETTDTLGKAVFTQIPIGEYEVYTSYEAKGIGVKIDEENQSEPLELQFPIEMHLSHSMTTVGGLILEWLKKPTTIFIALLLLLLTVGGTLLLNQDHTKKSKPENMVSVEGTKDYRFLGMDIDENNTKQTEEEPDYKYKERLKLSQLMVDEIRGASSATQVQRYWGDTPRIYHLKNDFYIDKTEVTVGQYEKFINKLKSNPMLYIKYQHPLDLYKKEKIPNKEKSYLSTRKNMSAIELKKSVETIKNTSSFKEYSYQEKQKHSFNNKQSYEDFIPKDWEDQLDCPNCPVVNVDYFMAWAYAKFVNKRLPTDIEWEISARGEDGRIFPWGNEYEPWRYNGYVSQYSSPIAVANPQYKKGWTPNGIADMAGNVDEWVTIKENNRKIETGIKGGNLNSRGIMFILNYGTFNVDNPSKISATTGFRCVSDNDLNTSTMALIEKGKYPIGGIHNYYFDIIRNSQLAGNDKQRLLGERPLAIPITNSIEKIKYFENGLKDFYIDDHEISVGEYSKFIDDFNNKSTFRQQIIKKLQVGNFLEKPRNWESQILDKSKPVRGISYYMAKGYCLNQDKRLPTIFEYEYLIGKSKGDVYPYIDLKNPYRFNSEFLFQAEESHRNRINLADVSDGNIANVKDESYKQNDNIYHLIGNVAEWAEDPRYMTGDYAYVKGGDYKTHGILGANRFYKLKVNKKLVSDNDIARVGFRCAKDK